MAAAAELLASMRYFYALDALAAKLNHEDENVRQACARAMVVISKNNGAEDAFFKAGAFESKDPHVRYWAVISTTRVFHDKYKKEIEKLIDDNDPEVKRAARNARELMHGYPRYN